MIFLRKISPKVVTFLVIICLSFTLTGCPSAPSTEPEIDLELVEFWNTFDIYSELLDERIALQQKYIEYTHESNTVFDDFDIITDSSTKFLKLGQKYQDILEEKQKALDKLMDNNYDQSHIISKLQVNVVKITDPSKRLLAQEIVDKLREMHNLLFEQTELNEKEEEYIYSNMEDFQALFLGKITEERATKNLEERNKKIEENKERLEELQEAIGLLMTEVLDLITKLNSFGPYK
ncbi:hypothetical protein ES703_28309 [subsurface metagenome]